jgi:hypothetical protein
MANRNTRRNRRNRKNSRRNRSRRGGGLFGTLWSPFGHAIQATGNAVGTVTNTSRNIVRKGLGGVNRLGRNVTGHADKAIGNLGKGLSGKRKSRRNRRN